ncbi:MAG: diacylglycerol kinase family lipid kinase [Elusimicrobiales bacterium]|nr:diacylglycerol kinase family lipid kinase [Elusimicrobiales bacterium]
MSYFFIINPNAGRKTRDIRGRLEKFFSGRRLTFEAEFTQARGHASELAAKALLAGYSTIVAVGGDGTIRETAGPLIGREAALGILPCGSGNGLARNLYIPLGFDAALAGLLQWEPRKVDAGLAEGKPFFCAAGVGLDAEVAHDFNSMSSRRGILPYVWHAARRVLSYTPGPVTAVVDGQRLELTAMVNAVLNGVQYGGGARVAPGAYIDDGYLDLVSIKKASLPRLLAALPALFSGGLDRHKDIYSAFKGRLIELDCGRASWYHLDGEDFYSETGKIRFSVLPGALKVRAPKPSLPS